MSKKASKAPKTSPTYSLGDVVLGKVRGYPSWPGRIVDPDAVPSTVTRERPPGKKATCYCVQFFPKGDYAWLYPKDISKLQKHEIEGHLSDPPSKTKGELQEGYRIALNPEPWAAELDARIEAAGQEEEEDEPDPEVDELEGSEGSSESKSKKRKRQSDAGAKKAAGNKKAAAKKAPTSEVRKKGGRKGTKSKANVESEDEVSPTDAKEEPPTKRPKREDDGENSEEAVKFKEWRHKLQKTFLGKTDAKAADMPDIDAILTKIENYGEIPTVALTHSKIGKVMKHIVQLGKDKKPRDDEFHFTERAQKLIDAWNPKGADGKGKSEAPEANGDASKADVKMDSGDVKMDMGDEKMGDDEKDAEGDADGEKKADGEMKVETTEMTDETAAMNLNGTATPAAEDADAPADADESMLADVTMSEAP
ncbi:hypothetical protein BD626DRAFT_514189 [Schizophyllum amplum]|uniref:PWWP domain-containing protein n=1 Tax=Schizophyllum amplum TaxID=97359 RepID=A0A550BYP0_9AGAR|nr:hypothetical protein BD626DRAFT_514189 [Auriculariopsis ampla]